MHEKPSACRNHDIGRVMKISARLSSFMPGSSLNNNHSGTQLAMKSKPNQVVLRLEHKSVES